MASSHEISLITAQKIQTSNVSRRKTQLLTKKNTQQLNDNDFSNYFDGYRDLIEDQESVQNQKARAKASKSQYRNVMIQSSVSKIKTGNKLC